MDAVRRQAAEIRRRHGQPGQRVGAGSRTTTGRVDELIAAIAQVEDAHKQWADRRRAAADELTRARSQDETQVAGAQRRLDQLDNELAGAAWNYTTAVRQATHELDEIDQLNRVHYLNELLAEADILPAGVQARDVGNYAALQFVPRGVGWYWTSADLVDPRGSGYLQLTVCRSAAFPPPTAASLRQGRGTCSEQRRPDGTTVTVATWSSDPEAGVTVLRVIAVRPDGNYVDIMENTAGSVSRGRSRPEPFFDAETMIRIATTSGLSA